MRPAPRLALALFLALPCGSLACRSSGDDVSELGFALSQQDLHANLVAYEKFFTATVEDAAERISAAAPPDVGREALRWKIEAIEDCRDALFREDPRVSLIDLWALCTQYRLLLTGDSAPFGEYRDPAAEAAVALDEEMRRVAERSLRRGTFAAVAGDVLRFAEQNPIGAGFSRPAYLVSTGARQGFEALRAVAELPLAPFRALQGVDTGAQALASVATAADRVSLVASGLPEQARWQLELAIDTLEHGPTLGALRESSASVASSADRLATLGATLPDDVEQALARTLERTGDAQVQVRETLVEARALSADARQTAGEVNALIESSRALTADAERLAGAVAETGRAWRDTVDAATELTALAKAEDDAPQGPPAPPVDWSAVAADTNAAAHELRLGIEGIHGLLREDALGARLADVDRAAESAAASAGVVARETIDHAALRAAQLIGLVFVLVVLLRLVPRRR